MISLAIFQFCQNGTFEPVHEIQKFFWPKVFFWSIMKVPFRKNIHNMPQGPSNPRFMQEKVQKGDFLKKPSRELKFFCCFRFLWVSRRPGTLNWKWLVFLLSKILYKKCDRCATNNKRYQLYRLKIDFHANLTTELLCEVVIHLFKP